MLLLAVNALMKRLLLVLMMDSQVVNLDTTCTSRQQVILIGMPAVYPVPKVVCVLAGVLSTDNDNEEMHADGFS